MSVKTKTIIIAEDHSIVRKGIVQILKEGFNHPLIDEVIDAESLITLISKRAYNIAIIDINLPGRSGLDAVKQIKDIKPEQKTLVLSINAEEHYGIRALKAGADGYLMKDAAPTELVEAVQAIFQGKKFVSKNLSQRLITNLHRQSEADAFSQLSDRELYVFNKLSMGRSIKEIASDLMLSVNSVSTYRSRIFTKMKFSSNAEIVYYAVTNGLI